MATYETGSEAVILRSEMGGDEGQYIQREAVYGGERVLPFADGHQRGCGIFVKLRNLVKGEAA